MADNKIKLTPKQVEIIKAMRDGWALKRYIRYWYLYKGGSEAKSVNGNSAFFLGRKGLIIGSEQEPHTMEYTLTDLGREIDID